jgi:hypothetical protein
MVVRNGFVKQMQQEEALAVEGGYSTITEVALTTKPIEIWIYRNTVKSFPAWSENSISVQRWVILTRLSRCNVFFEIYKYFYLICSD